MFAALAGSGQCAALRSGECIPSLLGNGDGTFRRAHTGPG